MRIEHRAIIKFLTKESSNAKEIHQCMTVVFGDQAPKYSTVAKWSPEFKHGCTYFKYDPRSVRPALMTCLLDWCIKLDEIALKCGISYGSVSTITMNVWCQLDGYPTISVHKTNFTKRNQVVSFWLSTTKTQRTFMPG